MRRSVTVSAMLFITAAWAGPTAAAEFAGQVAQVRGEKLVITPSPGVTLHEGDRVEIFVDLPDIGEAKVGTARVVVMLSKAAVAKVQDATGKVEPGQKVRILSAAPSATPKDLVSLFDGKTFNGWHANGIGRWTVENGAIVGRLQKKDWAFGHLISDAKYADFVLRLKFKLRGNSGVYVRGQEVASDGMIGLQVDLWTPKTVGSLVEVLEHPSKIGIRVPNPVDQLGKYYRPSDWNDLVVTVIGEEVACYVNDFNTAESSRYTTRQEGVVAIQLFGICDTIVHVKDISLERR
jgi:hypothetical protein